MRTSEELEWFFVLVLCGSAAGSSSGARRGVVPSECHHPETAREHCVRHGDRRERPEQEIEREADQHAGREPPQAAPARAAQRGLQREGLRAVRNREKLAPRARSRNRTRARTRRVQRNRERGGGGCGGRGRRAKDAGHVRVRAAVRLGCRAGRGGGGRARDRRTHVEQEACGLEGPRVYASNNAIVVSIHRTLEIRTLIRTNSGRTSLSRTLQYESYYCTYIARISSFE